MAKTAYNETEGRLKIIFYAGFFKISCLQHCISINNTINKFKHFFVNTLGTSQSVKIIHKMFRIVHNNN